MSKIWPILVVNLVDIFTSVVLFFFAPLMASRMEQWLWIALATILLLTVHFAGCYIIRKEHPTIWFSEVPLCAITIMVLSNINLQFFVDALELYGIYSRYSTETDVVLTSVPYYFDAIIFATLIISTRLIFFIPLHSFSMQNDILRRSAKRNIAKS